jgi:hypothetical protein
MLEKWSIVGALVATNCPVGVSIVPLPLVRVRPVGIEVIPSPETVKLLVVLPCCREKVLVAPVPDTLAIVPLASWVEPPRVLLNLKLSFALGVYKVLALIAGAIFSLGDISFDNTEADIAKLLINSSYVAPEPVSKLVYVIDVSGGGVGLGLTPLPPPPLPGSPQVTIESPIIAVIAIIPISLIVFFIKTLLYVHDAPRRRLIMVDLQNSIALSCITSSQAANVTRKVLV